MEAELKQRWVAALRSGEYAQTDGRLNGDGRFCCLGVLCKVMGAEFEDAEGFDSEGLDYSYENVPVLNGEVLSAGDDQELSLATLKTVGIEPDVQGTLVMMNDGTPLTPAKTFPEIADYIEKNL